MLLECMRGGSLEDYAGDGRSRGGGIAALVKGGEEDDRAEEKETSPGWEERGVGK